MILRGGREVERDEESVIVPKKGKMEFMHIYFCLALTLHCLAVLRTSNEEIRAH